MARKKHGLEIKGVSEKKEHRGKKGGKRRGGKKSHKK